MSSFVLLPSLHLLNSSTNSLLTLYLIICFSSNILKSSCHTIGARIPYSSLFMFLNISPSITGCNWNKSPIATILTAPKGSELPLISLSLLFTATVSKVYEDGAKEDDEQYLGSDDPDIPRNVISRTIQAAGSKSSLFKTYPMR